MKSQPVTTSSVAELRRSSKELLKAILASKKVMVIVNLAPRKMAGLESQGMILVAEDTDGNLALMTPEKKDFPAGSEIG